MQLKKSFRKGCQMFASYIEDLTKYKEEIIEDHSMLRNFEDVFRENPRFPPKRDIDFSIYLVPRASLVSKIPYNMDTFGPFVFE
jgi:hypothetical protein